MFALLTHTTMTVFLTVCVSLLVLALVVRFFKYFAALYVLLACACISGVPIAFFDLELGVSVFLWSALGCAALFFGTVLAGAVSALFAGFFLGPIAGALAAFKLAGFKLPKF